VILLGLGFTTTRLACRLLIRDSHVYGVTRQPERFRDLESIGLRVSGFDASHLPKYATIVHTIPPLDGPERDALHRFIRELQPRRIVYISATSVYGDQVEVDENTPPRPSGEKSVARFAEEGWLRSGPWRNLIVRPAAIYGPGRGVHEKIREHKQPRGAGSGVVSRIHVDDLAAVLEAGVFSDLEGAWPLADDHPSSSAEITEFCLRLMRLEPGDKTWSTFPVAGRRVDGRKIRELLSVDLLYPTYESGILQSLACSHGTVVQRFPS